MARIDDLELICRMADIAPTSLNTGWPGAATYVSPSTGLPRAISLHAAPVAAHRASNPDEVKIEPPGRFKPVTILNNGFPIVVGHTSAIVDGNTVPVLVAFDGTPRLGDNARWNQTFFRPFVTEAARNGWARYRRKSANGNVTNVFAFVPSLLVIFCDMILDDLTTLPSDALVAAILASGVLETDDPPARKRVRHAASVLERDSAFGKTVKDAYGGACAMCGLTLDFIEGAHVHPVEAVSSLDDVTNGIALCRHHHRAFDLHSIYIDPDTFAIELEDSLLAREYEAAPNAAFINNTFSHLTVAIDVASRLDPESLRKRYEHFGQHYAWASS